MDVPNERSPNKSARFVNFPPVSRFHAGRARIVVGRWQTFFAEMEAVVLNDRAA